MYKQVVFYNKWAMNVEWMLIIRVCTVYTNYKRYI